MEHEAGFIGFMTSVPTSPYLACTSGHQAPKPMTDTDRGWCTPFSPWLSPVTVGGNQAPSTASNWLLGPIKRCWSCLLQCFYGSDPVAPGATGADVIIAAWMLHCPGGAWIFDGDAKNRHMSSRRSKQALIMDLQSTIWSLNFSLGLEMSM